MAITFFDLFAGIGGFRLAFEREEYTCIGFCEKDRYAQKLYKSYFNTEGEYEWDDATTIIPEKLPWFDILTAGFPCQPFSYAGKRNGLKDSRAYPLWEAAFGIIKSRKPKIVLIENVKGLLSANRGWAFAYLLHQMDIFGYDAEWTVLNSKAFGVPQNRERVFIIFHLREKSRCQIFPIREDDKVYYKQTETTKEVGDIASTIKARDYASWNGNYIITEKPQKDGFPIQIKRLRCLTPLECFRLQGFPDDIVHKAKEIGISDSQLYKMAGNAVTVQVVQTIARKIKKVAFISR